MATSSPRGKVEGRYSPGKSHHRKERASFGFEESQIRRNWSGGKEKSTAQKGGESHRKTEISK